MNELELPKTTQSEKVFSITLDMVELAALRDMLELTELEGAPVDTLRGKVEAIEMIATRELQRCL